MLRWTNCWKFYQIKFLLVIRRLKLDWAVTWYKRERQ